MAIVTNNPVTIPAKAEVVADKISVDRVVIERQGDKWVASAVTTLYGLDGDTPVYALNADGSYVKREVATNDVYATAAGIPSVGTAVLAIMQAVSDMLTAQEEAEEQESGE